MDAAYNFNIQKIHDTVWVFKNAIENPQDYIDYFESKEDWKDWFTFGKQLEGPNFSVDFSEFPTPAQWEAQKEDNPHDFSKSLHFENKINDLFLHATKMYVEENNIDIDNWRYLGWNVAKYIPNTEEEYVMVHHTDYQREFSHNPGSKFAVTAVFYLNDNYTGGEVMFRFLDDNDVSIIKEDYSYKPTAGDIVVFLSNHPHYHGVKAITEGQKYIIRTYWKYEYSGHPLWLRLQEKYGNDIWEQMENERLKFNRNSDNIEMVNNIPFWVPFEEYYKKELEALDQ
jgi:hypothetical protein